MAFCKRFPSSIVLCHPNKCAKTLVNYMSGKCGSDDNKDGKNSDDNENKICPVCKSTECRACCPPMYDCRKYSHCLPGNTRKPCFEPVPNTPTDVFRCTTGEDLGPGGQADKCRCYPNPEYFSYQHMSYYDMHLILRDVRKPCPRTKRKP